MLEPVEECITVAPVKPADTTDYEEIDEVLEELVNQCRRNLSPEELKQLLEVLKKHRNVLLCHQQILGEPPRFSMIAFGQGSNP